MSENTPKTGEDIVYAMFPSIQTFRTLAQRVRWISSVAQMSGQWKQARHLIMCHDLDGTLVAACPTMAPPATIYAERDDKRFVWDYELHLSETAEQMVWFLRTLAKDIEDSDAAVEAGG